jgi:mannitol-1-phosphate 5-dehydrogenase
MNPITDKYLSEARKIVIFGAGKIGRSFIGQLFSRAGYEVIFIDIRRELINHINYTRTYKVIIKDNYGDKILNIGNIRGICIDDEDEVVNELAGSDIAAISVGQQGIHALIPVIAKALILRRQKLGEQPLDFIIAENMRNSDIFIRSGLSHYLPSDYPFGRLLGLVETSIGKMVPIMSDKDIEDDPLQVFAEPYNRLIVARSGFKNPIPEVKEIDAKKNIKAWVDRKIFIHNLGHAASAYLGFVSHPEAIYVYEVLSDPLIFKTTRDTMLQSADILMALYPSEFTVSGLTGHIDDLLHRFMNRALGDTIYRVGCDLYRKLGPDDRLVAPVKAAIGLNMPCDLIFKVIISAISFRATDEHGRHLDKDEAFFIEAAKGTNHILTTLCKLDFPA